MSDLQRVTFQGGVMDGAILDLPAPVAARVDQLDLTVTPAGRVYDRRRPGPVEGARVIEPPTSHRLTRRVTVRPR